MQSISLDGIWNLYYQHENQVDIKHPDDLKASGIRHIPGRVPGNVELDLVAAGELPEPFCADNVKLLRPYEFYEWWYETEFPTPTDITDQRCELLFHGTDCLATYWLNGERLGESDNMFIEHHFDVTGKLPAGGRNRLVVHLRSAVLAAMQNDDMEPQSNAPTLNWEQLHIRKAPHSYSWDIMPRVVSAGLWRPVELLIHDECEICDLYFHTLAATEREARLLVNFKVQAPIRLLDDLELRITGQCQESEFTLRKKLHFTIGAAEKAITNPCLWWPYGYGEPHLYDIACELLHAGQVIATRQARIGLRTVELDRTDINTTEAPGRFMFKINGTPVMCKGSNWVPADAFHSRDAGRYADILALVRDTHCNMVRCWGGNVYEDDTFFDLCDAYGIMVWQDFAMACACYPQTPKFLAAIGAEATAIARKLRNHPSLVIWCGDNECDESYIARGLDPGTNRITRVVLPHVLQRHDPYRPFLPSSPYVAPEVVACRDRSLMPEQHPWGPRDYYKGPFYMKIKARFLSEIGFHGCPNFSSLQRFLAPEYLWPWQDNPQWLLHCSDMIGKNGPYAYRVKLMADQITELFHETPAHLEDFILASQIYQAEAIKFHIENTRSKKWQRTGILWWNIIDGWPQFSDAVVDYYFGKKLAYYYIKRSQQPVCLVVDEPESWFANVIVCNDTRSPAAGSYRLWDADTGEALLQGEYRAGANENGLLGRLRVHRGEQRLFLLEWDCNGMMCGNHYLLGYPPFKLDRYRQWLEKIAALAPSFSA